jgi:hypothetical protein
MIMSELKDMAMALGQELMTRYWHPLYKAAAANPELLTEAPGFLLKPEELIFYFGRSHVGIEYLGPERISELPQGENQIKMQVKDLTSAGDELLNEIIGISFNDGRFALPLPAVSRDLIVPTNRGFDALEELGWNWAAESMIAGLNTGGVRAVPGQFTRIVNGRFFDADAGGLRTRHIKWLDLVPIEFDDSHPDVDCFRVPLHFFEQLAERDLTFPYPVPRDFKFRLLPRINRFVELFGNAEATETDITRFLANEDNEFLLAMRFSASHIHPEKVCEWADGNRPAIKPDFFVEGPDGYADIVEFKLPQLKGAAVVGRTNRETFSAELNSYVSQTRVYREYFEDPRNRAWVEEKYGFKVYKPKRFLVTGRRADFSGDDWRAIAADFDALNILSFDDLIDGVVVQFYR